VTIRGPCPQNEISDLCASLDVLLGAFDMAGKFRTGGARGDGAWCMGRGWLRRIEERLARRGQARRKWLPHRVAAGPALAAVLAKLHSNVDFYKAPPAQSGAPMRRSADQGREMAELNREIARLKFVDDGESIKASRALFRPYRNAKTAHARACCVSSRHGLTCLSVARDVHNGRLPDAGGRQERVRHA
jgi:hypothetical protein